MGLVVLTPIINLQGAILRAKTELSLFENSKMRDHARKVRVYGQDRREILSHHWRTTEAACLWSRCLENPFFGYFLLEPIFFTFNDLRITNHGS